ncbi:beta-phosphoglucomutase [Mesohalobacter halotolerans]|uniref:Beta-phosphoglucomutase n=1 Tax=Mesohalobacter halotolerans TaxID=1883405 RepID=A0A4U5TRC5_9FLAO|nr:beta-phosphoglucomutase [Mesohalobacter halotolerans]MBS3738297.1 beta-phosphoglucomutase [Psychroflexus sp.]TKS55934.1 beta-phosphoglucomutase [Mesohalobacter halotolerans]
MQKQTAFIFDLDGVIVDTAKFHFLAWQKLANKIGINFSEKENEQLKGVSRVKSLEKILSWGNKTLSDEEFQRLMNEKNQDYLNYVKQMTEADILPGVNSFLDDLKAKNHPIALGSASKNAKTILKCVKLSDTFEAIIDGTVVSKAKPDPEVFLKAAQCLNTTPSNCIVFEDSIAGIQAANAGGMTSIGIGDKNTLHEADFCFSNFLQFDYPFFKNIKMKA